MREPVSKKYLEQHYLPEEVAEMWGVSANTIRRLFEDEPDVLFIDRPEKMHKRGYCTMRIPESVVARVHNRWAKAA
jgi:hypothetical protein